MNINYYEKNLFCSTKKKSLITNAGQPAGQVNPKLNCETGQSGPHFAGQNGLGWPALPSLLLTLNQGNLLITISFL